jgi:tRNA 2-thiouridine synthesizing protein C
LNGYLLVINTKAPYHTSAAQDAFEAALAASNVGLEVRVLFDEDGVYQLVETQSPEVISHKNMFKKLCSFPLFDVEKIYVNDTALLNRGISLESDKLESTRLESEQVKTLIKNAHHVLVF